jgi:hypothetical protein
VAYLNIQRVTVKKTAVHLIIGIGRISLILKFNKGISRERPRDTRPIVPSDEGLEGVVGGKEETNAFVTAQVLLGATGAGALVRDEACEERKQSIVGK